MSNKVEDICEVPENKYEVDEDKMIDLVDSDSD